MSFIQSPVITLVGAMGFFIMAMIYGYARRRGRLAREVSQVARGQLKATPQISAKHIQRCLAQLQTSAYQHGTIFGVDQAHGTYVALSDRAANGHTLVVGVTGSGKTTTLENFCESVIARQLPLVYIDGKGDLNLLHRLRQRAQQFQRPFYHFSMVGESGRYNPLAFGGYTSQKDRIVGLRQWSEDHYRILAEGYLQTVLKILTLCEIPLDLYTLSQYLEPQALYALARSRQDPTLLHTIAGLEKKRKDMDSLIGEIHNMIHSEIGELFQTQNQPTLHLKNAIDERAIVVFSLQPLRFPAYADTLGKLIINDLKAIVSTQLAQPQKQPIYVILDEFSIFAGEPVVHLINQGRGAGICAILATQSLADITKKGGEALLGQIMNNCNHFIIQRQNDPAHAELLANVIGTQAGFEVTSQILSHQGSTGLGTVKKVREFRVHPDHIKRLKLGEAIYLNKQPFRVQVVQVREPTVLSS